MDGISWWDSDTCVPSMVVSLSSCSTTDTTTGRELVVWSSGIVASKQGMMCSTSFYNPSVLILTRHLHGMRIRGHRKLQSSVEGGSGMLDIAGRQGRRTLLYLKPSFQTGTNRLVEEMEAGLPLVSQVSADSGCGALFMSYLILEGLTNQNPGTAMNCCESQSGWAARACRNSAPCLKQLWFGMDCTAMLRELKGIMVYGIPGILVVAKLARGFAHSSRNADEA